MEKIITINGNKISLVSKNNNDFISLTDIAKYKNPTEPRYVIQNLMKTRFSVEFLGLWEQLNNKNFNRVEFDTVKIESGSNYFVLTPKKWIEKIYLFGGSGLIKYHYFLKNS